MRDNRGDGADGRQSLGFRKLVVQTVKLRLRLGKLRRERRFQINGRSERLGHCPQSSDAARGQDEPLHLSAAQKKSS